MYLIIVTKLQLSLFAYRRNVFTSADKKHHLIKMIRQ